MIGQSHTRWHSGKESACNAGDPGLITGSGISPRIRKWEPTPVFLPGKIPWKEEPRSYSLWGLKESDTTDHNTTQPTQAVTGRLGTWMSGLTIYLL